MTMKDTRKYKQTELGLLPEDWEVAKLGEKFLFISNNTFSRDFLCEDGEIKNIHYGDVLIKYGSTLDVSQSDIPAINSEHLPSYRPKCFAEDGDIIIADTAEDETVCKATELWNIGGKRVVAGLHTMWCRPAQNTFAIKFLGYFMNTSLYHNQVLPLIQGIKVSSVSKSAIQGTWLCIPPIEEQHRIASALTRIDNLIDSLDRLIAKKRDIKQGAMQQLLSGKKRLKGFTEPWVEKKLGDVALFPTSNIKCNNFNSALFVTTDNMMPNKMGIVPFDGQISYANVREYKTDDILTSNIRPYLKKIWLANCNGGCSSDVIVLRANCDLILPRFLYMVVGNDTFFNYSMDNAIGTKMPRGNKKALKEYLFALPSLPEQQAIAAVLTSMDNELSALEAKRKKYEQIKQGMMQQLLTGRISLN